MNEQKSTNLPVKQIKDIMYELLQEPTRENFRRFMKGDTGEYDNVDFKSKWIEGEKLAKILLSFANSGGGIIVIGISESDDGMHVPIGIDALRDKASVDDSVRKYISSNLKYEILNFSYKSTEYQQLEGKNFQMIIVDDNPTHLPFISQADGKNIIQDTIYIRRGTKCEKIKTEELDKLLQRKIEAIYPLVSSTDLTLQEHLDQLKLLYKEVPEYLRSNLFHTAQLFSQLMEDVSTKRRNPHAPKESYEQFINRMVEVKKKRIQKLLEE